MLERKERKPQKKLMCVNYTTPQHGTCYFCHQTDVVSGVVGLHFILWHYEYNDFRKCRLFVVVAYIYKQVVLLTLCYRGSSEEGEEWA